MVGRVTLWQVFLWVLQFSPCHYHSTVGITGANLCFLILIFRWGCPRYWMQRSQRSRSWEKWTQRRRERSPSGHISQKTSSDVMRASSSIWNTWTVTCRITWRMCKSTAKRWAATSVFTCVCCVYICYWIHHILLSESHAYDSLTLPYVECKPAKWCLCEIFNVVFCLGTTGTGNKKFYLRINCIHSYRRLWNIFLLGNIWWMWLQCRNLGLCWKNVW